MQNIFVVSTPSAINAAACSRVTGIILTGQRHTVTAHHSPAGIKSRGVICGVSTDFDNTTLNRMLMQPRNPSLLNRLLPQLWPSGPPRRRVPPLLQPRYATNTHAYQWTTHTCATNQCVLYAAKHTARATTNADIATCCLTGAPPSSAPSPTKASPTANTHPRTQPSSCQGYRTPKTSPRLTIFFHPADKPTWVDKVAGRIETHAAQSWGFSPQRLDPELAQLEHMYAEPAEEMKSLKQELAKY
ncbi:hypothetical protein HPB51_026165 [Rhipicephalus microplus]|uniref:Uncharacterized protein n=1 Tax=Rhipicephalus microplus TaxID=6941 RepID=A0A9J6DR75_RHIMP|nr:hypothetical protein HPB51_026165 [Rhipicephalus microplus]